MTHVLTPHQCDPVAPSGISGLEEARDIGFDELWQFFKGTGLVDTEKEAALAPVMADVRHTLEALHSRSSKEFNAIVMRRQGKLVGHVSGLRIYSKTWMFQHLAASPGHNSAPLLNLGALERFATDDTAEYFRLWFLPEARWPNRVFGGLARELSNERLSLLRSCWPVYVPTDRGFGALPSGIDIFEAREGDLAVVERYFLERESWLLRADDLSASTLHLRELDAAYGKLGLQRKRRIFLATRRDALVGFALLEISSPGLNLSEALSTFRLFVLPGTGANPDHVRRSLLDATVVAYRQTGRKIAVGLIAQRDVDDCRRLGLNVGPEWMCWTAHRSLYRRFYAHVDRAFHALRRNASRRSGAS